MTLAPQVVEQILKEKLNHSGDLIIRPVHSDMLLCYLSDLANTEMIESNILLFLEHSDLQNIEPTALMQMLPVTQMNAVESLDQAVISLLDGWTYIHLCNQDAGIAANLSQKPERQPSIAEIETHILGPLIAFTESSDTNLGILRTNIADPGLCNEQMEVGRKTRTKINIVYMKDTVQEQYLDVIRSRIGQVQTDAVISSSILMQMIQDNKYTIFPQMILTERPDRSELALLGGKILILVNGSPEVIICPASFSDFFLSIEDNYSGWLLGDFVRLLHFIGVSMSILLTATYVAALTFHYEVIPSALLVPLIQSRSKVPFPPLIETLILEVTMEFLREAGARLPSKVGQTMGIVGGIVIGQAAVQAGFTSNILIMLVALAALGSFTTPIYMMSGSIRLIRFPIIILAGLWGGIGIIFVVALLIIHLLRQTSLGKPYLYPIFPIRMKELISQVLISPKTQITVNDRTRQTENKKKQPGAMKLFWMHDIDE